MVKSARLSEQARRSLGKLAGAGPGRINLSAVARQLKTTRQTAKHWIYVGQKAKPSYRDAPGRGRKPCVAQADKDYMRKLARKGLTVPKIGQRLRSRPAGGPSNTTIRRTLKSGKRPLKWSPVKRTKQLSPTNKTKRLHFCQSLTKPHFRKWVFMDAKDLFLYADKLGAVHWAWQDVDVNGSEPPSLPASAPWRFRFYAAVSYGHKSKLYFVPPSPAEGSRQKRSSAPFDASAYSNMLKELGKEIQSWYSSGHDEYRIVQDHATQHTAALSKRSVTILKLKMLAGFPPQSWDLNVIENCWAMLDQNMRGAHARTSGHWRAAIEGAWKQVSQQSINKLVCGMRERVNKIIQAKGAWVKHH